MQVNFVEKFMVVRGPYKGYTDQRSFRRFIAELKEIADDNVLSIVGYARLLEINLSAEMHRTFQC